MTIKTSVSCDLSTTLAARQLRDALGDCGAVLYFASSSYNQGALAVAMKEAFGPAATLGCSTAGEIYGTQVLDGSKDAGE